MVVTNHRRLGGYEPTFDLKQLESIVIANGVNFMPTQQGYRSAFGSSPINALALHLSYLKDSTITDLNGVKYLFNNFGVFEFNQAMMEFNQVLELDVPLDNEYPWSFAYVGGLLYVCRKDFGLWQFNPNTTVWSKILLNVPEGVCSITSSYGRLVALGSLSYGWTAIGDGTDFTTSLATGAGFQLLSIINNGTPLAVASISSGFMVYTTNGIVKAEAVSAVNPFYHRVIVQSDYAPVNPKSVIDIGSGVNIFMTKTCLYATSGDYPQKFEEDMGIYLCRNKLVNVLRNGVKSRVKLQYSQGGGRLLIISAAEYGTSYNPYTVAYVFDFELQKWGRLDYPHFFVAYTTSGVDQSLDAYAICYGGADGFVKQVDKFYGNSVWDIEKREAIFAQGFRPVVGVANAGEVVTHFNGYINLFGWDYTSYASNGFYSLVRMATIPPEMSSVDRASSLDQAIYIDMAELPYDEFSMAEVLPETIINMAWLGDNYGSCGISTGCGLTLYRLSKAELKLDKLNSWLTTGPINYDNDAIRQATVVTNASITQDSFIGEDSVIDMMESLGELEIDMMDMPDEIIDMGYGIVERPVSEVEIVSSLDGYGNPNTIGGKMSLAHVNGNRYDFNAYSTGVYHTLTIRNKQAGDYYHIKTIEVTAVQGGIVYGKA